MRPMRILSYKDEDFERARERFFVPRAEPTGARKAITGTVQKVSNLILNINLYIRDVETKELDQVMSVDIRGNTDQSWSRGVSWLVRNRILKP